jgi:hypothetical protein
MNARTLSTRLVALTLVAANAVGLAAGCAAPTDATSDDASLGSSSQALLGDTPFAALGGSADLVHDRLVGNKCLVASSTDLGAKSSELSMLLVTDVRSAKKSLQSEISASYGIASGSAKFVSELDENELTTNYLLNAKVSYSKQVGSTSLTPLAESLRGNPLGFYENCGDGYVSSLKSGGSLYSLVKVHFKSVADKKTFEAKVGVKTGIKEFSVGFKDGMESIQKNATVSVDAVQIGGAAEQLFSVLAKADASGCAAGKLESCLGYIDSVQSYASGTFGQQFAGSSPPETSGVVDYGVREWTSDLLPQLGSGPDGELFTEYRKQQRDYWTLQWIYSMHAEPGRSQAMIDKQRKTLDADRKVIEDNKKALAQAWGKCWPSETAECIGAHDAAFAKLRSVEPQDLVPWFDATRDDGGVATPEELVDVNKDGRPDYCRRVPMNDGVQMVCQMGLGGGFEADRYGLVSPTFTAAYRGDPYAPGMPKDQPAVWTTLAGNPALCFARNPKDPSWAPAEAFCITSNGRSFNGMMSFTEMLPGSFQMYAWEGSPQFGGENPRTKVAELASKLRALKAWPYDSPR